jgi:hypothetical protein
VEVSELIRLGAKTSASVVFRFRCVASVAVVLAFDGLWSSASIARSVMNTH